MSERTLAVSLRQPGPIPLDLGFTCAPGQVLAIFGPSGSGKSTVLRSIAGLYRPEHASVQSGDAIWSSSDSGTFLPPHRRAVGFVFQDYALFPHLTAAGNVAAALGHRPRGERRARAEQLLALVALTGKADRRPQDLSGGERQRVALARAMARDPDVLLLDEPFAAVDRTVRRRLQDEVDTLRRTMGVPVILVTHDFEDVLRLATDVLLLERGRSVAAGPIAELTSRPDLDWLRDAAGLGAVFDATVAERRPEQRMMELAFDGGLLLVNAREIPPGARVRVRIPAREVILASRPPDGLSLHNVLSGTVTGMHRDAVSDQVTVQLAVGRVLLLADVTRDAIERLRIERGVAVHALIKSVSIDVLGVRPSPGVGHEEANGTGHEDATGTKAL